MMTFRFVAAPIKEMTLDELVMANALHGILLDRVKEDGNDVPIDLADATKQLSRELTDRLRDDKERRLRVLVNRLDSLKSNAEKRADIEKEIAALRKELK